MQLWHFPTDQSLIFADPSLLTNSSCQDDQSNPRKIQSLEPARQLIPRFQKKCIFFYVQIQRFHHHRLTLTIKSSMFHSLATRNECDAFSSGQFSRSAKDPISPFFFCWQGLRAGIRAILGTVAQCRKSALNPFLALWHFILKAFLIAHFFHYTDPNSTNIYS